MTHGCDSSYTNRGCRCAPCREAHRVTIAEQRRVRAELLARNPGLREHGDAGTYQNWGCRCTPCRLAIAVARQRWAAR
jgi:hypothetical protein